MGYVTSPEAIERRRKQAREYNHTKRVRPGYVRLGRPPRIHGDKQFNVRADDAMHAAVMKQAAKQKVPVAEIVRTYIEWGLENEHA